MVGVMVGVADTVNLTTRKNPMSEATFTTRDYVKHLVDAGDFTEKQAEALAEANVRLRRAEQEGGDGLVTKKDLELAFARHETKQLKWGIAVVTTHTVIILGVVYALFQALFQALSLK